MSAIGSPIGGTPNLAQMPMSAQPSPPGSHIEAEIKSSGEAEIQKLEQSLSQIYQEMLPGQPDLNALVQEFIQKFLASRRSIGTKNESASLDAFNSSFLLLNKQKHRLHLDRLINEIFPYLYSHITLITTGRDDSLFLSAINCLIHMENCHGEDKQDRLLLTLGDRIYNIAFENRHFIFKADQNYLTFLNCLMILISCPLFKRLHFQCYGLFSEALGYVIQSKEKDPVILARIAQLILCTCEKYMHFRHSEIQLFRVVELLLDTQYSEYGLKLLACLGKRTNTPSCQGRAIKIYLDLIGLAFLKSDPQEVRTQVLRFAFELAKLPSVELEYHTHAQALIMAVNSPDHYSYYKALEYYFLFCLVKDYTYAADNYSKLVEKEKSAEAHISFSTVFLFIVDFITRKNLSCALLVWNKYYQAFPALPKRDLYNTALIIRRSLVGAELINSKEWTLQRFNDIENFMRQVIVQEGIHNIIDEQDIYKTILDFRYYSNSRSLDYAAFLFLHAYGKPEHVLTREQFDLLNMMMDDYFAKNMVPSFDFVQFYLIWKIHQPQQWQESLKKFGVLLSSHPKIEIEGQIDENLEHIREFVNKISKIPVKLLEEAKIKLTPDTSAQKK